MRRWQGALVLGLCLLPWLGWGASGDNVVTLWEVVSPATSGAVPDTIAGGSTPAEVYPVWVFPDAADTFLDYKAYLTKYAAGGLTCRIYWASPATTNNVVWQIGVRRILGNTEVITGSQTYTFNTVTQAAPAANTIQYADVTITNGAQMDSWAVGEFAWIRVRRDPTNGSDTLADTANLVGLRCTET